MNSTPLPGSNAARSRLRATVATIEREIARLPAQGVDGSCSNSLIAAYTDLVEQLALGPEPEVRECPVCKHTGMRAATLCGYCWTKLTPPTDDEDETAGAERYDIGGEG